MRRCLGLAALSSLAWERYARTSSLSAAGQLSVATIQQFQQNPQFSGGGTLSAIVGSKYLRDADLAGTGVLSASNVYAIVPRPSTLAGAGLLTVGAAFPASAPDSWSQIAAGTYTYNIPYWCRYIDIVLLGAGGGGASSGPFYLLGGFPGSPGTWATVTLERGVHIPWDTATITLVAGTGGARGSGGAGGTAGGAGTASTASAPGWAGLSAPGGAGGPQHPTGVNANDGPSPGNKTYNGQLYTGGGVQTDDGGTGKAPGGAGAGGSNFGGSGGVGGPGGVWVRSYQ